MSKARLILRYRGIDCPWNHTPTIHHFVTPIYDRDDPESLKAAIKAVEPDLAKHGFKGCKPDHVRITTAGTEFPILK